MGLRDDAAESRVAAGDQRFGFTATRMHAGAVEIMIEVRDSLSSALADEPGASVISVPVHRDTINAAIGKLNALIEFYR